MITLRNQGTFPQATCIGGSERLSRRYPAGRVCDEDDCGTILSIYARGPKCWEHTPLRFRLARGKRLVHAA